MSREVEYNSYLSCHIKSTLRTWSEILCPVLIERKEFSDDDIDEFTISISHHDVSKYDDEEYYAYLEYFYPTEVGGRDEDYINKVQRDFDIAWLHHIHKNPHHWQYWILVRDNSDIVCKDMPVKYIFEMLCDWHSFSLKDPSSTAYNWYHLNKYKIMISQNTRKIVEEYIEYLKEPLKGSGNIGW